MTASSGFPCGDVAHNPIPNGTHAQGVQFQCPPHICPALGARYAAVATLVAYFGLPWRGGSAGGNTKTVTLLEVGIALLRGSFQVRGLVGHHFRHTISILDARAIAMSQQLSSYLEHAAKKRKTRRGLFLERIDRSIPWEQLGRQIPKHYPKAGNARKPLSARRDVASEYRENNLPPTNVSLSSWMICRQTKYSAGRLIHYSSEQSKNNLPLSRLRRVSSQLNLQPAFARWAKRICRDQFSVGCVGCSPTAYRVQRGFCPVETAVMRLKCAVFADLRPIAYRLALTLLLAAAPLVSNAATKGAADAEFSYVADSVFAVGDVHGAYDALISLLRGNELIDADNRWSGGRAHLVSLGDLVDRGARSRQVMDLFRRLQSEARAAGGRVHVLLGNHEVMNLTGDLRDVSDAEFAAYAANSLETAEGLEPPARDAAAAESGSRRQPVGYDQHRRAFSTQGDYGRWLLSLPVMVRINDTLYAHGGLSPLLGGRSLVELNGIARRELLAATRNQTVNPSPASLLGADGPLWYRGSAACHPLLERPVLQKQLANLSAQRLVIGHTPTPTRQVRTRLDKQVYAIDTGMLASVYRGQPFLLALSADNGLTRDIAAIDADSNRAEPIWWHPLLVVPPESEATLVAQIAAGETVPGAWVRAKKKEIVRQQALWRLDRALGLWMTPTTVADPSGKRYFHASRSSVKSWITERERREQGRQYPNYCATGHQNLLISAFDALTGVTTRGLDTLLVHRATGVTRLAPIAGAFPTSTTLPRYATMPSLPAPMAERLDALDAAWAQALLGDLLTTRQISALLKRRDKILQWPRTAPTIQSAPSVSKEQAP